MRNHSAYVICFVQELIPSSNTDCQAVCGSRLAALPRTQCRWGPSSWWSWGPAWEGLPLGDAQASGGALRACEPWPQAPWLEDRPGVYPSQSSVKFMKSLDIKSVGGGHGVPPSASGSFGKNAWNPDFRESVNSADSCPLGKTRVCVCVCVCMRTLSCFSCVRLFATPWTLAHQALLSMGFSRQEYWRGLPWPPSGVLPNPRVKSVSLMSPALAGRFFTTSTT